MNKFALEPVVGFIEANQLTRRINELFHEKEIQWNDDYTDILYDRELMIEL